MISSPDDSLTFGLKSRSRFSERSAVCRSVNFKAASIESTWGDFMPFECSSD